MSVRYEFMHAPATHADVVDAAGTLELTGEELPASHRVLMISSDTVTAVTGTRDELLEFGRRVAAALDELS